ncbi:MAG TPA: plasmid stabilization protein [Acetobacteraceae bacterium]
MASITIPDLDGVLERRLRTQADSHGRSVEDEARDILHAALNREPLRADGLVASIRAKMALLGGVDLPHIPREPIRKPPFQDE